MRTTTAALLLTLVAAMRADAGELPEEKERALREFLTKVLAESDPSARKTLAGGAAAIVGDAPLVDVVASVRKGPVLAAGLPKPRKVAGKTEEFTTVGNVVVGYSFVHGGATYRYAVDVPRGYDSSEPCGLLLDPGHGSAAGKTDQEKAGFLDMWRRFADESGNRNWLVARTEIIEQIGADGARGARPEDEIAQVFDAFFRDVFSRFCVDPDCIYVTGVSQTGFWAWVLGTFRADRFAGIAPMSSVTWQVDRCAGNLLSLPVYVLHGDADPICPVDQPRKTCAMLQRIGVDVQYREVPGGAHNYAVWQKLPAGLTWLGLKPRQRYPKRVSKSVRNTSGPWCSWIRIDAIEEETKGAAGDAPTAGVDAEIDGQTIRVFSDRVTALTVCLSSEMLDLAQPATITWNGESVHKAVVKPSAATLFELAGEKCDWSAVFEAAVALKR